MDGYYKNEKPNYSVYLFLFIILIISVASKMVAFNGVYYSAPERIYQVDSSRYEKPALALLQTGTLAPKPYDMGTSAIQVAPAYPAFISTIYSLFNESRSALIMVQVLISTLTVWLVYLIAASLWSKKTGLLAAILMVLDPLQFYYSQVVMSETLFVSMSMLFILFSIYMMLNNNHRYQYAVLLGLALAAATMVRPASYYLIFPVVLGIVFCSKSISLQGKKLFHVITLILMSYFIVVGSWQIRNGNLLGVYLFTDNASTIALQFKAAGVLAYRDNISPEEAYEQIKQTLPTHYASYKERLDINRAKVIEVICENKVTYLMLSLKNLPSILLGPGFDDQGRYYGGDSNGRFKKIQGAIATSFIEKIELQTGYQWWYICLMLYSVTYLFLLYLFLFYGLFKSKNDTGEKLVIHLFLLGFIVYFIFISTGNSFAYSRLRVPMMPIFILYGSYGLHMLLRKYKTTGRDWLLRLPQLVLPRRV